MSDDLTGDDDNNDPYAVHSPVSENLLTSHS